MLKKLGEKRTDTKTMTTQYSRRSEKRKLLRTLMKIHKMIKRTQKTRQCSSPKAVLRLDNPQQAKEQQPQEAKAKKEVQNNNNNNKKK